MYAKSFTVVSLNWIMTDRVTRKTSIRRRKRKKYRWLLLSLLRHFHCESSVVSTTHPTLLTTSPLFHFFSSLIIIEKFHLYPLVQFVSYGSSLNINCVQIDTVHKAKYTWRFYFEEQGSASVHRERYTQKEILILRGFDLKKKIILNTKLFLSIEDNIPLL